MPTITFYGKVLTGRIQIDINGRHWDTDKVNENIADPVVLKREYSKFRELAQRVCKREISMEYALRVWKEFVGG